MNGSKKGILLTVFGGVFWGISGVSGQYMISVKGVTPYWLTNVRLLLSGAILVLVVLFGEKNIKELFKIWSDKRDVIRLFVFSIFGVGSCQLTYYMTIQRSNASTATVLQYTSPVIIMLYLVLKNKKLPKVNEIVALVLVVFGVFMLVTHGKFNSLAISAAALAWGLTSAVNVAFYNIIPVKIMNKYGTMTVLGWGMVIGGIVMTAFVRPWNVPGVWDVNSFIGMFFVIIVGTVLAFWMYLEGVRLVGASKASLLAASEPITSALATALIMGAVFTVIDVLGIALILVGVAALSYKAKAVR